MIVTHIELSKKGKAKTRVFLEDGTCFPLYQKEVRKLELLPGCELSQEQYMEIVGAILVPRAKRRAMHLLEQMDRTEAQLREKLKANEYPLQVIEEAISYVKKYHYIDDYRYACNYIRYRCHMKSRRQLTMELYQKGVKRQEIEQAMEEEYEESEIDKIQRWLEKKHYDVEQADRKQQQRMYQFLLRRGFSMEDILKAIHAER